MPSDRIAQPQPQPNPQAQAQTAAQTALQTAQQAQAYAQQMAQYMVASGVPISPDLIGSYNQSTVMTANPELTPLPSAVMSRVSTVQAGMPSMTGIDLARNAASSPGLPQLRTGSVLVSRVFTGLTSASAVTAQMPTQPMSVS